jgi:hypothetical protein
MVPIPPEAVVLGVDRQEGMDDMVRAKIEVSRSDFAKLAAALPMSEESFSRGPGRLGSDSGFWNPRSTSGVRSAQVVLPNGRALHVGFADGKADTVLVFVMNHGM